MKLGWSVPESDHHHHHHHHHEIKGFEVLKKVQFVGNDLKMDPGIGTCGKNGQGVPVGVGQPTLKINELTVGGTSN